MYDVLHLMDLVCLVAGLLPHSSCRRLDMAGASATMQAGARLTITPKAPMCPCSAMPSCSVHLHLRAAMVWQAPRSDISRRRRGLIMLWQC